MNEPLFDEEQVDYLLRAIEHTKCKDCREQCGKNRCIYMSVRAKLSATKEARDEK